MPAPQGRQRARQALAKKLIIASTLSLSATMVVPAAPAFATPGVVDVTAGSASVVQRAVDAAKPGMTIRLHAGTYIGQVEIRRAGTMSQPITLQAAGDGPVVLRTNAPMPACGATSPMLNRALTIKAGWWRVRSLTLDGGVIVSGNGGGEAMKWLTRMVKAGNWQARRAIPGRGKNDPVAARSAPAALSKVLNTAVTPADGVQLIGNHITGAGVYTAVARYGLLQDNEIGPIHCGTGPGAWINIYSDGWRITGNRVHDVAASTWKHYMQEGIRIGGASAYNDVEGNQATNLPGNGWGFTTDYDASWNHFALNTASNVAMGYNDEQGGWGNRWDHNAVDTFRERGFVLSGLHADHATPSQDTAAIGTVFACNRAVGGPLSLFIGEVKNAGFTNNRVAEVQMNDRTTRAYFGQQGNRWNGSSSPVGPPAQRVGPPAQRAGSGGQAAGSRLPEVRSMTSGTGSCSLAMGATFSSW